MVGEPVARRVKGAGVDHGSGSEEGGKGGGLSVEALISELSNVGSEVGGLLGGHGSEVAGRGSCSPFLPIVWPWIGPRVNRYLYSFSQEGQELSSAGYSAPCSGLPSGSGQLP